MTGAATATAPALNAAAKEFVPPALLGHVKAGKLTATTSSMSPDPDAVATLQQSLMAAQSKEDVAQAHLHHLSINAPAFVPRAPGHHPATPDRPSERPAQSASSVAPSLSGSSTSGASRAADCCAPEEGDEEGEAGAGACGESSAGGCCECGAEDGECGHSSNAGEECAGGAAYGGGALEHLPYRWEGGVPYNGAVYYDAAFVDPYGMATYGYLTDGSFEASQCQAYYDAQAAAAAAAYYSMMGDEEGPEGEEGEGGTGTGTSAAAGRGAGGAAAAETAESQLAASDCVEGLAASLAGSGKGLAASEARELLELFFPHYAGAALARLLARTGGDLTAAFAELAALERQAAAERAAERAAAAAGASTSGRGAAAQYAGKGKGGAAAAGGKGQQQGQAHGQAGKGKGGAFKLDPEAFPTLAGSPTKQPQQQTPSKKQPQQEQQTQQSDAAAVDEARELSQEQIQKQQPKEKHAKEKRLKEDKEDEEEAVEVKAQTSADATPAVGSQGDAAAKAPKPARAAPKSPAQVSAKPNFAAMLRNSVGADSSPPAPAAKQGAGKPAAAGAGAKQLQLAAGKGSVPAAAGVPVPRVATGTAAAAQYGEERAEAAVLARARNAYFMQATLAYLSGDKALARQLGRKGRAANEAMKAAHAAAAARIFAARNAHVTGRQQQQGGGKRQAGGKGEQLAKGSGKAHAAQQQQQQQQGGKVQGGPGEAGVRFVDLHGLHVAEAVAALEAQIEAARSAGCSHLRVCTGTGSHTKGAKTPARLPAAVADTLLAHHITFRTLQPGLLEGVL